MAKAFVVSDVHSYYDELMEALTDAGFDKDNPDHIFISCGDLCDRGPAAVKCLSFVNSLPNNRKILIRGNHEDLMEEAICRGYFKSHDYHNRTNDTVYQVTGIFPDRGNYGDESALEDMKHNELWKTYIDSCVDYYENDNYIFVHGWIPIIYDSTRLFADNSSGKRLPPVTYNPNWRTASWVDWEDARWINGMQAWDCGIKEPSKIIHCGHWHTSWGHAYLHNDGQEWLNSIETFYIDPETGKQEPHCNHGIFEDDGICALDACTAISGQVNCKVIDNF